MNLETMHILVELNLSVYVRHGGTVVGFVCLFVCLAVIKLACSKFDTAYVMYNKG